MLPKPATWVAIVTAGVKEKPLALDASAPAVRSTLPLVASSTKVTPASTVKVRAVLRSTSDPVLPSTAISAVTAEASA